MKIYEKIFLVLMTTSLVFTIMLLRSESVRVVVDSWLHISPYSGGHNEVQEIEE